MKVMKEFLSGIDEELEKDPHNKKCKVQNGLTQLPYHNFTIGLIDIVDNVGI